MKRAALFGVLVVSLVAGSAAIAGPGGRGHDDRRGPSRSHHVAHRHFHSSFHSSFHSAPRTRVVRHRAPVRHGAYRRPGGYHAHRWARGERLPVSYYARPYVIADYRSCGLRVPPRGYHWVRVDGDAVLAAVATGIVLDTVFHVFN